MTRRLALGLRTAILIIVSLGVAWLGGLIWFGANMPRQAAERTPHTDAIIVLTGGAGRLAEGGRLLTSGSAGWLFVSGVNTGVGKPALLRVAGIKKPGLADFVILGYSARNTRQNAQETAVWLKRRGFTSIRLVTANYHMRRATLEFRRDLPKVRIIAHPVVPRAFNTGPWWQNMTALSVVVSEYNKYLAALLGGGDPLP